MTNISTRVVKVGGSLFDLPELGRRIHNWLAQQSPAFHLFVAGGGQRVDLVRRDFAAGTIDEISAHWRCIELMNETAALLAGHLALPEPLDELPARRALETPGYAVFSAAKWLRDAEPQARGTRLPASWDVTSDSIAARLAICWPTDELVLLKSAAPLSRTLWQLANMGYIDRMLPRLESELPKWRMVNLRAVAP